MNSSSTDCTRWKPGISTVPQLETLYHSLEGKQTQAKSVTHLEGVSGICLGVWLRSGNGKSAVIDVGRIAHALSLRIRRGVIPVAMGVLSGVR